MKPQHAPNTEKQDQSPFPTTQPETDNSFEKTFATSIHDLKKRAEERKPSRQEILDDLRNANLPATNQKK